MSDRLEARFEERLVGVFTRSASGALFEYSDGWRHDPMAFALSLSLPLTQGRTEGTAPLAFVEGLLPDNPGVRRSWERKFHVNTADTFGLLRHVGRDVAGAVQYIDPSSGALPLDDEPRDLTEHDLSEFIRRGLKESAAWGVPGSAGRFSLAGQQAKMAVHRAVDGWKLPSREEPSTHILKPGLVDYEHSALGEHLTMCLARSVGLNVADTEMVHFEDVWAVAVTRFDRVVRASGGVSRVHQEDFCQALAVMPELRYESGGGPGVADMADALSRALRARDAVKAKRAFLDAIAFNWLTLGTDAHAKNYSLQHMPGRITFAPLYDLMSAAPYPKQLNPRSSSTTLAQSIGGEDRFRFVEGRHWARLARTLGRKPQDVVARVEELADLVCKNAPLIADSEGYANSDFADRWQTLLVKWARSVTPIALETGSA